jgi:hypothetical protein
MASCFLRPLRPDALRADRPRPAPSFYVMLAAGISLIALAAARGAEFR